MSVAREADEIGSERQAGSDRNATDEQYSRGVDASEGVPIDDELNEVDDHTERPIDRVIGSLPGSFAGAGLTGLAKGMGMWVEPEEVAVIREAGEPPRDPDDPIEITIDLDHPENTRIVYRVQSKPPDEPSPN